ARRRHPARGNDDDDADAASLTSVGRPAAGGAEASASRRADVELVGLPVVVVDVGPVALVHADVEVIGAGLEVEVVELEPHGDAAIESTEPDAVSTGTDVEHLEAVAEPVQREADDRLVDRHARLEHELDLERGPALGTAGG